VKDEFLTFILGPVAQNIKLRKILKEGDLTQSLLTWQSLKVDMKQRKTLNQ
jgi:hypothetical protein